MPRMTGNSLGNREQQPSSAKDKLCFGLAVVALSAPLIAVDVNPQLNPVTIAVELIRN